MKTILSVLTSGYFLLFSIIYQHKPLQESIEEGGQLYQDFCIQCHGASGEGVPGSFPPLAQSDYLRSEVEKSIQGLKYGMRGPIVVNGENYNSVMVAQGLDDEEIADIMNYIRNSWGNHNSEPITPDYVTSIKRP